MSEAEMVVARAVRGDGADGVVGDGHRAAARRADAEGGAAAARSGDGNRTRAGAAADGVARDRADVRPNPLRT